MQKWQRQPAQCILCAFHCANPRSSRIYGVRNLSSSGARSQELRQQGRRLSQEDYTAQKDRSKGRGRVPPSKNAQNDGSVFRKPSTRSVWPQHGGKSSGKNPILRADGKPLIRTQSADELADSRMNRRRFEQNRDFGSNRIQPGVLKKGLDELEKTLQKHKPARGVKTQMQILDPEQRKWGAFRKHLGALQERALSDADFGSSESRDLWARLVKGYHDEDRQSFEKELLFAFTDFVVQPDNIGITQLDEDPSIDLRHPTDWYKAARQTQRAIHLHVGPTNSGKTYNALKRLQESKNGFFAGPLRLLAHEVYSRFQGNGIPCDLITGDDVRISASEDAKVYASTVEMVECARPVDVAVIDEIQMIGHEERGWAWTRAFFGANAKEVHLCGEERVVPLIRELSASLGDTLQVHRYKRLNALRCMSKSLRGDLKKLRKGDCVVAFSVVQIHELKKQIEVETGKRCAIVYGSLPPETRAAQADLFNDPDNDYDYLVASDAIGMGLNLAVRRIIFYRVTRWDGEKSVILSVPQIKQIAGRAGRFRTAHQNKNKETTAKLDAQKATEDEENVGWVTTLDEADLPIISKAMNTEAPFLKKAGLTPPAEFLDDFNSRMPAGTSFEYLLRTVQRIAETHPRFFLTDTKKKMQSSRLIDDIQDLSIEQRVNLSAAPLSVRNVGVAKTFRALARTISKASTTTVVDIPEIPLEVLSKEPTANREYLASLEELHKSLILYLWLSYRFEHNLRDRPMAQHAKELTEQKINTTLQSFSANPILAARLKKLRESTDDSIASRTEAALAALKEMEAQEARASSAQGEDGEDVKPNLSHEDSRIQDVGKRREETLHMHELLADESFDEHFVEPAGFTTDETERAADEAETLEVEAAEQMVGLPDTATREPVSNEALVDHPVSPKHDPSLATLTNSKSSADEVVLDDNPQSRRSSSDRDGFQNL